MSNGTQNPNYAFRVGERLRECREWRGLTRAQLVEAVEKLPDNNNKTRSEKQIGYIENGTRQLSKEYAHLLADALCVRVEYLMLKDDYKTECDRIESYTSTRGTKQDIITELMRLHGYELRDATQKIPILKNEEGREYRNTVVSLISPGGSERFLSPDDLLKILMDIDDYVEYQCSKPFRKKLDGVKNTYALEV